MWRGHWRFLLPYRSGCLYEFALARTRSRARKKFSLSIHREEQRRVLEAIFHFFRSLYNPEGLKELIRSGGAPLICTIVFVETGFFVGFFLPGDSLLVTAGIFSARRRGRTDALCAVRGLRHLRRHFVGWRNDPRWICAGPFGP